MKNLCACLLLIIVVLYPAQANEPVRFNLHDGVRLVIKQEPTSSLVAITVFVETGSAQETLSDAGIGSMVADTLLTGTVNENPDTIANSIGAIGGNVKSVWAPDMTQIRALILPGQFSDAAYILAEVLKNANFPDSSVENSRQDLLSRIQERSDDVFDSTNDRLRSSLYSGTAYDLPQVGTIESVKKLDRAELLSYFHRNFRPDNTLISIVGNIDPKVAEQVFGDDLEDFVRPITHHISPMVVVDSNTLTAPLVIKTYRGDVTAGLMMAGYLAPGVGTTDYPAMLVTNALLGGMKTGLMFKNLRTKKKYGYELASNYTAQVLNSDVTAYILYAPSGSGAGTEVKTDMTSEVKDALIDQFRLLYADPPSDTDLERAKKFVIGSYLLAHERIEDRSYYLGYAELTCKDLGGFSFDERYADAIDSVTAADVVRVAKKYFGGQPVISLLLPGNPSAGVQNY